MIQFIYKPHLSAVFSSCWKCCRLSKAAEFNTSLVSCYFPFSILVWKVVEAWLGSGSCFIEKKPQSLQNAEAVRE